MQMIKKQELCKSGFGEFPIGAGIKAERIFLELVVVW